MDEIEACEKVAAGLFQMAAVMRDRDIHLACSATSLEYLADSIESDRDDPGMQALAQAMLAPLGLSS